MKQRIHLVVAATATATVAFLAAAPLVSQLPTRWAKDVDAATCHPEYPRPHLVRRQWQNLNGLWDYAITPATATKMGEAQGRILVPFPVESELSRVKRTLPKDHVLWYRRAFQVQDRRPGREVRLNFGAVDWRCEVFVNGRSVGVHQGGYDAFGFDVSQALVGGGTQEVVVRVEDPSSDGFQPRGKQVRKPRGIWYTASSGIWQTVWLEQVPRCYVRALHCETDLSRHTVTAVIRVGDLPVTVSATVLAGGEEISTRSTKSETGGVVRLALPVVEPRPWSPADPFLYDLAIRVEGDKGGQVRKRDERGQVRKRDERGQVRKRDERGELRDGVEVLEVRGDGKVVEVVEGVADADEVRSYFGMREIAVARDARGVHRLFLNGAPLFHLGPLDQGFWPDGLYTAPTDAALRYDLEQTKALGFNMVRKHVKVEPERWYYHCDKLGLMVWQDMPSGDRHIGARDADLRRSRASAANYFRELGALIDGRRQHPCIVVWVPFNEGWGQFETDRVLAWVKARDPSRLVDGPSGWTDRGTGDMHDVHRYPGPGMPKLEAGRAAVLGEFGGLGLPIDGHLWWDKRNWGYRTFRARAPLQAAYEGLIRALRREYSRGLSAAVYTQTTDVEGEVNGLMTYDRAVLKLDAARLRAMHERFYSEPPVFVTTTLVPTSERRAQDWRYTTTEPAGGSGGAWFEPAFDDGAWRRGAAGFGAKGTPGAVVRTAWTGADIWLRRRFDVPDLPTAAQQSGLHLRIHHDEDATVYLNGHRVAELRGYTTAYVEVPVHASSKHLRKGRNVLAVHCHQTRGGQYIDAGIVAVEERAAK